LDSDPNMTRVHEGCEAAFLLDRRDSAVLKLIVQVGIYWLRRLCSRYTRVLFVRTVMCGRQGGQPIVAAHAARRKCRTRQNDWIPSRVGEYAFY